MRVVSQKKLREFWEKNPAAETPLRDWYRVAKHATWESFDDVRAVYASADQVGQCVVFNIGGNKFRLIVVIKYKWAMVYVRHVLTHAQYDKGKWKEDSC